MKRPVFPRFRLSVFVSLLVVSVGWCFYHYSEWAFDKRTITASTASPFFRFDESFVTLAPGARACIEEVAFTPRTGAARFIVHTRARPRPPVALTVTGPGYRATAKARSYKPGEAVDVPFEAPERELLGEACIENAGDEPLRLSATREGRTASRSATRVDGRLANARVGLHLLEAQPSSFASNVGDVLARIAAFSPPYFGVGVLWVLVGLVLLGLPLGLAWAFAAGVGRSDEDPTVSDDPGTGRPASRPR